MLIDYGHLDLSIKDYFTVGILALTGGEAIGYLFYDSLRLGILISFGLFLLKSKYRDYLCEKRKGQLLIQFRDLLYSISSSISVGRSMGQALSESIEFWAATYSDSDYIMIELRNMERQMKEGNEKDLTLLQDFAKRSNLDDVADFVRIYESCRGSGANLIKAINRATRVIGDKITLEKELKTLMAQKRFEGRIVMLAPFAIMLFLKIVSPEYLAPLTATSQGQMIATLVLSLIGGALFMSERINKIEI